MNIATSKFNLQAQLWALIGPLIITVTLFVVLLRASSPAWELPLVAVAGLIVTYKWHWKGVLISSFIIAGLTLNQVMGNTAHDWLWTVTLSCCLMAALVVTGLTVEESHHAWDVLHKDLESARKTLATLTETAQAMQSKFFAEKQEFVSKVETLERSAAQSGDKEVATERLVNMVREELAAMHEGQERLLQELYEARQQLARSDLRFDPSGQELQQLREQLKGLEEIKVLLESKEETIRHLKVQEEIMLMEQKLAQEEAFNAVAEHTRSEEHIVELSKQNLVYIQEKEALEIERELLSQEKNLLEGTIARLQSQIESMQPLSPEDKPHEIRKLEGLNKQIREQFDQKAAMLDLARRDLFMAQERVGVLEKEIEEAHLTGSSEADKMVAALGETYENELVRIKAEYEEEIASLNEIITKLSA